MPALPADIAAASRDALVVTWASVTIATRYPSARDASVTPATGYCDTAASAQALVDARGVLLGVERRRFSVGLQDLLWPDLSAGLPAATLVDAEQGVNAAHLFARVEIDLDAETTTLETFG